MFSSFLVSEFISFNGFYKNRQTTYSITDAYDSTSKVTIVYQLFYGKYSSIMYGQFNIVIRLNSFAIILVRRVHFRLLLPKKRRKIEKRKTLPYSLVLESQGKMCNFFLKHCIQTMLTRHRNILKRPSLIWTLMSKQ